MSDKFTFENVSNSYFQGNDVHVTREKDGRSIIINEKDRMLAVNVKAYPSLIDDPALRAKADDLDRANANGLGPTTDDLWRGCQRSFWHDAEWLANDAGYDGVTSAGRSGGWCCLEGVNVDEARRIVLAPADDEDRDEQRRLLGVLFQIHGNIAYYERWWRDKIAEAHADLQREREAVLVRGED